VGNPRRLIPSGLIAEGEGPFFLVGSYFVELSFAFGAHFACKTGATCGIYGPAQNTIGILVEKRELTGGDFQLIQVMEAGVSVVEADESNVCAIKGEGVKERFHPFTGRKVSRRGYFTGEGVSHRDPI
jgi:hypothetical protein